MSAPSGVFVVLHPIYYFINSFGLAVTGLPTASRLHSRNDIWHESWYLAAWRTHKLPVSTGSDFCIRDSLLFLTADGKSSGADEPKRLSNFFRISVKRRPGVDSSYSVLYSLAVPSRKKQNSLYCSVCPLLAAWPAWEYDKFVQECLSAGFTIIL